MQSPCDNDRMDILGIWKKYSRLPLGRLLFHQSFYRKVPYTATVKPRFITIEAGYALVEMKDCRNVRNHLESIHAVALMNLGEVSTGVAVLTALPPDARAILKNLSIEFLKKARGTLRAEARQAPIASSEKQDLEVVADIKNAGGETVSRVKATWRVGPSR